ncbi:MAG TPA: transglutaminase family protein [Kiloniellales bacterium]|nr:transglutaminase family protein [Kiloniellales bacterium]
MPTRLTVKHSTLYSYARPVTFNEHRLMFRPRDSHDMRLLETGLRIVPAAQVRWFHDVFSNSIAIATFEEPADSLLLESTIVLEHYGSPETRFPLEPFARTVPFSYASEEIPDLGRTIERHYPDPHRTVDAWARRFLADNGHTDTEELLVAMTRAIKDELTYETRTGPLQTPVETLERGVGTCRDYTLLMMEAVRSLGMAARFVSGYLYDPALDGAATGTVGAGHTHAWAQVYLPGAGWVEFDPTNGLVGGPNLIRVAVARDPSQAIPVQGSYNGLAEDFLDMTVEVSVHAQPAG